MQNLENRPMLSLVIPCRNEAKRLPRSLDTLLRYVDQISFVANMEILFSIEKSEDGTVELVRQKVGHDPRFSILEHQEARGKGFNVRKGMLAARGECILFMDADLSVPLRFIPYFLEEFSKRPDLDILIATRRHPASCIPTPQPWIRRVGGKMISVAIQALAITTYLDTQCGFKAFRRAAAHQIFSRARLDGFSFDLEVLTLAQKMNLKVEEYPVEWNDVPGSSVQPFTHGMKLIRDAVYIRFMVRNIS